MEIKNKEALENIVKLAKNDKITIKVSGTATIKEIKEIGLSEMEIPINRQKVVELPTKLKNLKDNLQDTEDTIRDKIDDKKDEIVYNLRDTRDTIGDTISNVITTPTSEYLYIYTYPKDNIKVGNSVTITVLNENNIPVEGATVTIYDGTTAISKTTGNMGTVVYIFRNSGTHTIKAEKDGYYPREISIDVEKLIEQPISDRPTIVNRLR